MLSVAKASLLVLEALTGYAR